MSKKIKTYVENNVESDSQSAKKKNKKKYKKGKFPYTVKNLENGNTYVRKAVTVTVWIDEPTGERRAVRKQRQIWRVCDPPTKEQAEKVLQDITDDIYYASTGAPRPLTDFCEIADRYAEAELVPAVYSPTGEKIAGRRSLNGTQAQLNDVKEFFVNRDIHTITYGDLQDFKAWYLKKPIVYKYKPARQRSIRSVNSILSFLRAVFYFAYRRRWVDRIPFTEGKAIIDKSAETRRDKTWTRDEEARALEACKGKLLAHMKVVIICSVDGGFRRGELLASLWSECDFENGTMIARSYKGKSLHTRTVYMTRRMKYALIEWRTQQRNINKIKDKTRIIGYNNLNNAWKKIRASIGRPDLHLHDLRHVFATRLDLSKQVSIKQISELLGHSNVRTTQIYLNSGGAENLRDSIKVLEVDTE